MRNGLMMNDVFCSKCVALNSKTNIKNWKQDHFNTCSVTGDELVIRNAFLTKPGVAAITKIIYKAVTSYPVDIFTFKVNNKMDRFHENS